ncbi:hypothetical protein MMC29_005729 [Sticta canariensis]|nr:hypothetical protein [Sticta canariensis]
MITTLAVALVVALAATAQAGHAQHHHAKRHYGYGAVPAPIGTGSTVSPVPVSSTTSLSASLLPSSSVPLGTGPSASLSPSSSVPLGTGPSASLFPSSSVPLGTGPSASLFPSSSVPLGTGPSASLFPSSSVPLGTGPSASLFPSSSVPLGTGPSASLLPSSSVSVGTGPYAPFPTHSGSLSASQNPSSTVPHGAGVTGAPSKVSIITSDSVLTYTVGTGESTTVIITTIRRTLTSTLVQVSVKQDEPASETLTVTKEATNEHGATGTPEAPESPETPVGATTTKRNRITSTAIITVYPVPSGEPTGSVESPEVGQNHVKAVGSSCAPQVTVTVPGPEVTVTVTATVPVGSASGTGEEATEVPTVSPLPSLSSSALFNNGTLEANTRKSKTSYLPTGFLTSATASFKNKPSATSIVPIGTGAVHSY